MQDYDKSSKWLIQHHGDSILRLAGIADIATWRPLQAEVVQPRRLPDGLIEVYHRGQIEPDLVRSGAGHVPGCEDCPAGRPRHDPRLS